MFETRYRREIGQISLPEERLEQLITAMGQAQPQKPSQKAGKAWKTVLLAAALCAALAATALAVSPGLREALVSALGAFAPYSREIEGVSVIDQGLEVKVISALSDGNTVQIYFTVQDLEENRLDQDLHTNFNLYPPSPNQAEWHQSSFFSPGKCISYDPETKTALFSTRLIGDGPPATDFTLSAIAQVFTPGYHEFRFDLPELALTSEVLATTTLSSGETVLVPEQAPMNLEQTDIFSLSSCGFGADGRFHILYQCHIAVERADLRTFLSSRIWESGDVAGNQLAQSYNRDFQAVIFQRDGKTYYDSSYEVGSEHAEDILPREVYGCLIGGKDIQGSWELDIPIQNAPARTVDLREMGTELGGVTAKELALTSISATIESDPNGSPWTMGYELTAYLSDGTLVRVGKQDSTYHSDGYATDHWTFPEPIDPEDVVAIAIGQWYVPIEGGIAGQGHWLPQQP